jgi:hypothetical protein
VSDTFDASRKFRILAVNDDCCCENQCFMADTRISGARVARELDALVRVYGKPACIFSFSISIYPIDGTSRKLKSNWCRLVGRIQQYARPYQTFRSPDFPHSVHFAE